VSRDIFIGDIHGCYDELIALINRLDVHPEKDHLYLCGDVINRGPKNLEVMEYLLENPWIKCVMGNHEYYYLKGKKKRFAKLDAEFGDRKDEIKNYLKQLPTHIETDSWLLIHGGLKPGGLEDTPEKDLVTLRTLKDGRPWHHAYNGSKTVIYGHWSLQGLTHSNNTWGLDSGCVYGGQLNALILPEKRIISEKAKMAYFS
jgi:predicted phosphodiesterase